MQHVREIVFDTETTGRDPDTGDRIVEIGAVELINLAPTGRVLHKYICPECDVPEEVVRVHGLTTMFLRDKPKFRELAQEILDFFEDSPLIAHNSEFDRKFVNAELRMVGYPLIGQERTIDTLMIARKRFPGASNSLDALSRRFQLDRYGFDLAGRKGPGGHGALVDAKMLAEVYLQLRGGRERTLVFEDAPAMEASDAVGVQKFPIERRAPRPVALEALLTAEEAEAHAAFVTTLGENALWLKAS